MISIYNIINNKPYLYSYLHLFVSVYIYISNYLRLNINYKTLNHLLTNTDAVQ